MKVYLAGNGGLNTPSRVKLNRIFKGRLLSYFEILIHPGDKQWRRCLKLNIFGGNNEDEK